MNDSSLQASAVVRAAIKRLDPVERLRQAFIHSEQMRELSLAQLRKRYPDHSTLQLVELMLGQQLIPRDRASESR
jgi:hypothetical protein